MFLNKSTTYQILIKLLPLFIRKRIEQREEVKKVITNIGWLFFDKFLRMGVGMFVGVLVARYLEPEKYGVWNYAIAFSSVFSSITLLGLDRIAVRELVKKPESHNEILGSIFLMRLCTSIVLFVASILAIYFIKKGNLFTTSLVALSSFGFVVQSIMVIDFYYQAELKNKFTVYAQNVAFLIGALLRVLLVVSKSPLVLFATVALVEIIIGSILLLVTYFKIGRSPLKWKYNAKIALAFLRDSWPYILTSVTAMIYMRIDQIMIGSMLGDGDVGVYSAAVKISEIWFFIPMSIVASLFPAIIKSRSLGEKIYIARMQKLSDVLTMFGIVVAVIVGCLSNLIIMLLYGKSFVAAAPVLTLHIWVGAIICLGATQSAWITAENLQVVTILKSGVGAVTNVVLNLILIPIAGIKGAAIATVFAQLITTLTFFNKRTWEITQMGLKSLFLVNTIKVIIFRNNKNEK